MSRHRPASACREPYERPSYDVRRAVAVEGISKQAEECLKEATPLRAVQCECVTVREFCRACLREEVMPEIGRHNVFAPASSATASAQPPKQPRLRRYAERTLLEAAIPRIASTRSVQPAACG